MKANNSIMYIKGIGEKRALKYKRLGIETIEDLLYHFPVRYEDRTEFKKFNDIAMDEKISSYGTIVNFEKSTPKRGMTIIKIVVRQGQEAGILTVFNNEYIKDKFHVGDKIAFYGKAKRIFGRLEFNSPEIEPFAERKTIGRIYPIYPLTAGINNGEIQRAVEEALKKVNFNEINYIPNNIEKSQKLCPNEFALKNIHLPENVEALKIARYRLVYEEFFIMQMYLALMKNQGQKSQAYIIEKTPEGQSFLATLPFSLTKAQEKVIEEIENDIQKPYPMQRLVQGDVGSGKTIVAFYSAYITHLRGYQSTIMVPTEILAKQHFQSALELFKGSDMKIRLLTGSTKKKEKEQIYEEIANHQCDLVIGTHAIIQEQVQFKNLALAVTDEQHRFGVKQRNSLYSKYEVTPHVLVMTATPIPRTLSMIIHGDLDISIIDEMPKGRKPIETMAVQSTLEKKAYEKCIEEMDKGKQVYIVCPLVEESEELDIKSAEELYGELKQKHFKKYKVGLIHGKMKTKEKSDIMGAFEAHELDVLVSTTVIEVGINVPNATVMVIQDAQRFGLSQLHQLRGRVGRGSSESYCILIYKGKSDVLKQRMEIMSSTGNGFVIAEKDLLLRGPGEVFGLRQHGLPELKLGDVVKHIKILHQAQGDAQALVKEKILLSRSEEVVLLNRIKAKFDKEIEHIAMN